MNPQVQADAELLSQTESAEDSGGFNQYRGIVGSLRRLVQPVLLLGVGAFVGIIVHNKTQDRIVPPIVMAKTNKQVEPISLIQPGPNEMPTQHGPLPPGKTPFGGGFIVGDQGGGGTCYAAACDLGATCCRNLEQAGYCCAAGNYCHENACMVPGTSYCFAGDANVDVRGKGTTAMQDLHVGDHVLVQQAGAKLDYEPVLGFLHATRAGEPSQHLIVSHPSGKLRVSPNHIVFLADGSDKLAADLLVGDELAVAQGSGKIVSIESTSGYTGMYAPLTASGTIVVDGAIASNYATHSSLTLIPHTAIHTAFFPLRLYHALGLASLLAKSASPIEAFDSKHPFVAFLEERVKAPALKVFNVK